MLDLTGLGGMDAGAKPTGMYSWRPVKSNIKCIGALTRSNSCYIHPELGDIDYSRVAYALLECLP